MKKLTILTLFVMIIAIVGVQAAIAATDTAAATTVTPTMSPRSTDGMTGTGIDGNRVGTTTPYDTTNTYNNNYRTNANNMGTYRDNFRTTATNDNNGANWGWLGLLGLIGLAGLMGRNRTNPER